MLHLRGECDEIEKTIISLYFTPSDVRLLRIAAFHFTDSGSLEKAVNCFNLGTLAKMHFFPKKFGGIDDERNIVYTPQFAVDLKTQFDARVQELVEKGFVIKYYATPRYKGNSFIPSSIELKASGERTFEEIIKIW